ncbi:MAG: transglycosylase SLT domain-containing protein, partial [Gammaproteobacteria bacterium]|nr:transglycosylase SLT domain-containing protein [Gammaproteobacteria bacterium]
MSINHRKPISRVASIGLGLSLLAACQSLPYDDNPAVSDQTQASEYNAVSLIAESSENHATQNKLTEPVVTVYQFNGVWDRIQAGFKLSGAYDHPSVISQLANYADNQRFFEVIAQRSSPFLYWIVEEIEDRGLPMELALVPVVESTFNPNAYSREHAVGLWQFIGPTAKSFGLQQDWWYDARRDPRASTLAALDYFEELYG